MLSTSCVLYYNDRPEKVDFVRMAGLMDAIIVPFSAVGISDSVNILLDQNGTCHMYVPKVFQRTSYDRITSAYLSVVSIILSLANRNI